MAAAQAGAAFSGLRAGLADLFHGLPVMRSEQVFGMDTDEVLAYSTKKVVWIRDRYVGCCYYSLVMAVIIWVIGGQILVNNEHFLTKDVEGLSRMWYAHPTKNNCDPEKAGCHANFTNLQNLSYCDAYDGPKSPVQAHCEYQDKLTLVPGGVIDEKLFLTTAIEKIVEKRHCAPSAANNYTCENTYTSEEGSNCLHPDTLCRNRGGHKNQFFYVADIKNYKVRFTSSYARDDIRGTSLMHPAFVGICPKLLRVEHKPRTWSQRKEVLEHNQCKEGEAEIVKLPCEFGVDCAEMRKFDILESTGVTVVSKSLRNSMKDISARGDMLRESVVGAASYVFGKPRRKGPTAQVLLRTDDATASVGNHANFADASSAEPHAALHNTTMHDEYSDNWGDVFSVGRLLQLAGADLDADFNMDGWTTRQAGTVLEVRAVYNNLYPVLSTFGYKPVQYHYKVSELMLPYVSRMQLAAVQPDNYPEERVYEVRYGILIHFKVAGSFGFFNLVYLLLMLTTAFALTATATTLTDLFFLYLSDHSDNFFHLKYEVTPDFSDMWRCDTCGFYNLETEQQCRGVPRFMCPKTTPPCGAPRPNTPPASEKSDKAPGLAPGTAAEDP